MIKFIFFSEPKHIKSGIITICLFFIWLVSYSQNGLIGNGFGTDNWSTIDNFNPSAGTSRIGTFTANGTGDRYFRLVTNWGGNYNQWGPSSTTNDYPISISTEVPSTEIIENSTSKAYYINVSNTSYYYIFKTKEGNNPPANKGLIVFEVQGSIQSLSSHTVPSTAYPGITQRLTVAMSGILNTGQATYIRYHTGGGFNGATISQLTYSGSGNDYFFDIPASDNIPGTTITYYFFTSGSGLTITNTNADFYSINLLNNGGSNYNYTVDGTWQANVNGNWNTAGTWNTNKVPPLTENMGAVSINADVTLNVGASLTSLTISAGKTLIASDATPRTLTFSSGGVLTCNGTFTHGNGLVSFAGSGVISGTVGFNDLSIAGGVDFGTGTTINGTLTINGGGYGVNASPPTYASGSTLKYNTGGTYARNTEWGSATHPHHVTISNNTVLDMGANSGTVVDRRCMGNLTIDAGSTFSMNATPMSKDIVIGGNVSNSGTIIQSTTVGSDIFIKGNWVANNILTHNDRAIFFNGTLAQEITSGATNFGYLLIDNPSGVSINGSGLITVDKDLTISLNSVLKIKPNKFLTVTGGIFNNANTTGLIIESTAAGTGSLIHNTADVQSTIERYVTGSTTLTAMRYHQVSIPLTPASDNFSIIFLDSYLFDFTEPTNNWNGLGTPIDTPLDETRGYMTYAPVDGTTYYFPGPMNNGNFLCKTTSSAPYDNYHGWNLVPNPYPSAINWVATAGWTKTYLDAAYYTWNASLAGYASYLPGVDSTNGGNRFIPLGQAFFVHSNNSLPILSMNNNVRVHNLHAFFKTNNASTQNSLRLKASSTLFTDEIVIHFMEDATEDFDSEFDAYKLAGGADAPQLASLTQDGTKLSINSLPFSVSEKIIPLYFSLNTSSEVTFTATGQENFTMTPPIYLEDLLLNKVINLQQQPVYTFLYEPGQTNRFQLRFINITATENDIEDEGVAFYSNNKINIDVPSMIGKQAVVNTFDIAGRLLRTANITMNGIMQVDAPTATGVYIVRVISGNNTFVRKVVVR